MPLNVCSRSKPSAGEQDYFSMSFSWRRMVIPIWHVQQPYAHTYLSLEPGEIWPLQRDLMHCSLEKHTDGLCMHTVFRSDIHEITWNSCSFSEIHEVTWNSFSVRPEIHEIARSCRSFGSEIHEITFLQFRNKNPLVLGSEIHEFTRNASSFGSKIHEITRSSCMFGSEVHEHY